MFEYGYYNIQQGVSPNHLAPWTAFLQRGVEKEVLDKECIAESKMAAKRASLPG